MAAGVRSRQVNTRHVVGGDVRTIARALGTSRLARILIVAVLLLIGLPLAAAPAHAQDDQRDPREIATTNDEAGKQTTLAQDVDGTDDFGHWVDRRWLRDRDSLDVRVGPIVIDNIVWVAKDTEAAKKLFRIQADLNEQFPERDKTQDGVNGPFPFPIDLKALMLAEDTAAMSGCLDCNAKQAINLHQRIVFRKKNVVGVIYLYGREQQSTAELAVWFFQQVADRVY